MFIKVQGFRKLITLPSDIFDDTRLSLGAKGLYVQLYYSNDNICALEDLTKLTGNAKEELQEYFSELAKTGYIETSDKGCKLLAKAPKATVTEETVQQAEKYAEEVQPKKENAYEQIKKYIYGREYFSPKVKDCLFTYFINRLNKQRDPNSRYYSSAKLNAQLIGQIVTELVSFHLDEDTTISVIQKSIDKEWNRFFMPTGSSTSQKTTSWDKSDIVSGSYTPEDIERIKQRAQEMEENGEEAYY